MSPYQQPTAERERIQNRLDVENFWRMPWADFEILLGLRPSLNMRNMSIDSPERSIEFLKNCGFSIHRAADCRNFEQFYCEALFLIRNILMTQEERQKFPVPSRLLHLGSPHNLFMYASNRSPRLRYQRLWACAIIKVFFAISNLEYSDKLRDIDIAREQILGKIKSLIRIQANGLSSILPDSINLALHAVEWKESKTRTSIILKLLHKPESATDEVFDYLGVRFVVKSASDLPVLLKLLVEKDIIIPQHVLAVRSKNTLFNLTKTRQLSDMLLGLSSMDLINGPELNKYFRKMPWIFSPQDDSLKHKNPASSHNYRSLQLTVRHLVRIPNPAYPVVESLLQQVRHFRGVEQNEPSFFSIIPQESARYFPLEIQIMDADGYDQSRFGKASHEQYKAAQLKVVRERILAGMLFFTEDKISTQII